MGILFVDYRPAVSICLLLVWNYRYSVHSFMRAIRCYTCYVVLMVFVYWWYLLFTVICCLFTIIDPRWEKFTVPCLVLYGVLFVRCNWCLLITVILRCWLTNSLPDVGDPFLPDMCCITYSCWSLYSTFHRRDTLLRYIVVEVDYGICSVSLWYLMEVIAVLFGLHSFYLFDAFSTEFRWFVLLHCILYSALGELRWRPLTSEVTNCSDSGVVRYCSLLSRCCSLLMTGVTLDIHSVVLVIVVDHWFGRIHYSAGGENIVHYLVILFCTILLCSRCLTHYIICSYWPFDWLPHLFYLSLQCCCWIPGCYIDEYVIQRWLMMSIGAYWFHSLFGRIVLDLIWSIDLVTLFPLLWLVLWYILLFLCSGIIDVLLLLCYLLLTYWHLFTIMGWYILLLFYCCVVLWWFYDYGDSRFWYVYSGICSGVVTISGDSGNRANLLFHWTGGVPIAICYWRACCYWFFIDGITVFFLSVLVFWHHLRYLLLLWPSIYWLPVLQFVIPGAWRWNIPIPRHLLLLLFRWYLFLTGDGSGIVVTIVTDCRAYLVFPSWRADEPSSDYIVAFYLTSTFLLQEATWRDCLTCSIPCLTTGIGRYDLFADDLHLFYIVRELRNIRAILHSTMEWSIVPLYVTLPLYYRVPFRFLPSHLLPSLPFFLLHSSTCSSFCLSYTTRFLRFLHSTPIVLRWFHLFPVLFCDCGYGANTLPFHHWRYRGDGVLRWLRYYIFDRSDSLLSVPLCCRCWLRWFHSCYWWYWWGWPVNSHLLLLFDCWYLWLIAISVFVIWCGVPVLFLLLPITCLLHCYVFIPITVIRWLFTWECRYYLLFSAIPVPLHSTGTFFIYVVVYTLPPLRYWRFYLRCTHCYHVAFTSFVPAPGTSRLYVLRYHCPTLPLLPRAVLRLRLPSTWLRYYLTWLITAGVCDSILRLYVAATISRWITTALPRYRYYCVSLFLKECSYLLPSYALTRCCTVIDYGAILRCDYDCWMVDLRVICNFRYCFACIRLFDCDTCDDDCSDLVFVVLFTYDCWLLLLRLCIHVACCRWLFGGPLLRFRYSVSAITWFSIPGIHLMPAVVVHYNCCSCGYSLVGIVLVIFPFRGCSCCCSSFLYPLFTLLLLRLWARCYVRTYIRLLLVVCCYCCGWVVRRYLPANFTFRLRWMPLIACRVLSSPFFVCSVGCRLPVHWGTTGSCSLLITILMVSAMQLLLRLPFWWFDWFIVLRRYILLILLLRFLIRLHMGDCSFTFWCLFYLFSPTDSADCSYYKFYLQFDLFFIVDFLQSMLFLHDWYTCSDFILLTYSDGNSLLRIWSITIYYLTIGIVICCYATDLLYLFDPNLFNYYFIVLLTTFCYWNLILRCCCLFSSDYCLVWPSVLPRYFIQVLLHSWCVVRWYLLFTIYIRYDWYWYLLLFLMVPLQFDCGDGTCCIPLSRWLKVIGGWFFGLVAV